MSILTTHLSGRRTVSLAVLVLALAVAVAWALRPASDAAPSTGAAPGGAGTITFAGLGPGTDAAVPVLGFSTGGSNTGGFGAGGGAGAGKFNPQDVNVVLDSSAMDPHLLRAVATGAHLQRATVSLADGAQEWLLEDVIVSSVAWGRSGAKDGNVSVSLTYRKIRLTANDSRGQGVATYCYNVATVTSC